MTEPYYFETEPGDIPGRVRGLSALRARKRSEGQAKRQTAIQLRTMIAGLEREIANLDSSISSELELCRVREPSHFAYPILVRTMQARRENLEATIAVLLDRLASD
jgi:hypothetical protein